MLKEGENHGCMEVVVIIYFAEAGVYVRGKPECNYQVGYYMVDIDCYIYVVYGF